MKLQLLAVLLLAAVCHVSSQAMMQGAGRDPNSMVNMSLLRAIMMNQQRAQGNGQTQPQMPMPQMPRPQMPRAQMPRMWPRQTQYVPFYIGNNGRSRSGLNSLLTGALVAKHDPFEDFFSSLF